MELPILKIASKSENSTQSRLTVDSETSKISEDQVKSPFYPDLEHVNPCTTFPRSLPYQSLMRNILPNVPDLLIQLVQRIDENVPPITKISYGINSRSLSECDRILTTLIAVKTDKDLCENIIENCTLAEVAQLIQLLFLRLENAPFVGTPVLCDLIREKGFFIKPYSMGRHTAANSLLRAVRDCLNTMSIYQQATAAYFIERCQRWCQAEVAYQIEHDPALNAANTYTEALRFLGRMFGNCVIQLPDSYVASKIISGSWEPEMQLKRELFTTLVGVINTNVWHSTSIQTLHYNEAGSSQPVIIQLRSNQSTSSDVSVSKQAGLPKVRSFNWN